MYYSAIFLNPRYFAMCVFLASFQESEVKHLKGRACVIILGGPMRMSLSAARLAEEKTKIVGESK